MDNVVQFRQDGRGGQAHLQKAFEELRVLIEGGELEGMIVIGTVKDGNCLTCVAGQLSTFQMVGLLEATKAYLLSE